MRSFELFVPKFDNNGKAVREELLTLCIRAAVECGGGATVREAKGYWIGSSGKLFRDDVHIVCTDVADADVDSSRAILEQIMGMVKADTEQEAVYLREFAVESKLI